MKLAIQGGGSLEVSDGTFDAKFNEALIHQVVTAYMARGRAGTKAQKTRAEVRGGGRKPFNQKGSGRARAGTIRGPIWVGGGRAFAAKPRDYSQKVNRKMYQAAMRSVLSELVRQERLVIVDDLKIDRPKTRDLAALLGGLDLRRVLILVEGGHQDGAEASTSSPGERNIRLAARNLPFVDVLELRELNPVSLLRFDKVLATSATVKAVAERLT
ncbi:MAG: 50S ribosomal protein L4 [Gammaproteobacteria bacterium]